VCISRKERQSQLVGKVADIRAEKFCRKMAGMNKQTNVGSKINLASKWYNYCSLKYEITQMQMIVQMQNLAHMSVQKFVQNTVQSFAQMV
jgi:hypothetical protein